jgi:hypothetical protein
VPVAPDLNLNPVLQLTGKVPSNKVGEEGPASGTLEFAI